MTADASGGSDDRGHGLGWGDGLPAGCCLRIALAFSSFQLWTAAFSPLPSQIVRAVHVGFLLLVAFGLLRQLRRATAAGWFWLTGGLAGWPFWSAFITGGLQALILRAVIRA